MRVGPADDRLEREADATADAVVRRVLGGSPSFTSASPSRIRRAPRPSDVGDQVIGAAGGALPTELESKVRRSTGKPLDGRVRATMESSFGADFSAVRVHENSEVAPRIQARAFTSGTDIHFAPGEASPSSAAGMHTLAHELTHVTQQGGGPLRRKIGFEFEDNLWHPWKVDRGTTWATAANVPPPVAKTPAAATREELALDQRPAVTPVARKQKIHVGNNFRLEGDDTPGPHKSNIEFVTEPFSEDINGLRALAVALNEMLVTFRYMAASKGRPGPEGTVGAAAATIKQGPPWPHEAHDYVTERLHGLSGGDVNRANLLLSGGSAVGMFKMQATSGVTLADVPKLLTTFGTAANETPEKQRQVKPARDLHKTGPTAANVAGQAPALALQVIRRMIAAAALDPPQRAALADVKKLRTGQGFVSLVIMYLKGMQVPAGVEGAKARVMFLARNKFSTMYATMDPAVQALLATNRGALFCQEVLAVSNATPLVAYKGVHLDDNLQPDQPLINPQVAAARINAMGENVAAVINPQQTVVTPFTVRHFLESIAIGDDHLTPQGMATWLQVHAGIEAGQAQQASDAVFESFGEYGMDTDSGDEPLALLENRSILPEAHKGIMGNGGPLVDVARIAFNYLLYEVAKQRGMTDYPDVDLPAIG